MKLDITLCYSIIEYYFDNFNQYEMDNKSSIILDKINQHSINLNFELESKYEEYFKNNRPELLGSYQDFITNMIYSSDGIKILDSSKHDEVVNITSEEYYSTLLNNCYSTKDKVLISDKCDNFFDELNKIGIELIKTDQLLDINDKNLINLYSLPIIGIRVGSGLSSQKISEWIGRFLKYETDIKIIDGYIYQNANNFYNYFLKYVEPGTKITIYTLLDKISENDIISEFKLPKYKIWSISIYIINSKKDQHARNIFTNNYYIHIEKGMAIFGRNGITDQSDVSIAFSKHVPKYNINKCKKVI